MSDAAHAETHQNPPSMFLTVVGGLGLLTVFLFMVLLFIGRGAYAFQNVDTLRETERYKILEELQTAASKAQEGPAWVNKDKGLVTLSLEKSMTLVEEKLKAKKPAPGVPIPTPAPAAPAPAAPAAAPAPSPAK